MQLKFVASVAASPTVRLNLHDPGALIARQGNATFHVDKGLSFPPPPLRRATAGTLLADGVRIPAAAYDNRTLHIPLVLRAPTADAQAASIQALVTELNRPSNILMWQPDKATQPVFFRTFRCTIDDIMERLYNYRRVTLELLAEPFAVGPEEALSNPSVSNDPAAVSNACFFDVTGIKGDVETPLILTFGAGAGLIVTNRRSSAFAVRRRGTPSNTPLLRQAEALTLGTDTTLPGNDPLMSGSSSNYARCSFGTATNLVTRLSGFVVGTGTSQSVDYRGTYRVYARVRQSVSGDQILWRLRWGSLSTVVIANDTVGPFPVGTVQGLVDLGLVQMPVGADPVHDGYSGVELPVLAAYVELQIQRASGSGNCDVDYLLFVPADDRLLLVKWPSAASGSTNLVVDGTHEMVFAVDSGNGSIKTAQAPETAGGFPLVSPNVTNRVFFLPAVDNNSNDDNPGITLTISPSYFPRYLYVRPVST